MGVAAHDVIMRDGRLVRAADFYASITKLPPALTGAEHSGRHVR
jgi:hypothetical protein